MCSPKAKAPDTYENLKRIPYYLTELTALSGMHLSERRESLSVYSDQEKSHGMTAKLCYSSGFWHEVQHKNVSIEGCLSAFGTRHCSLRLRATRSSLLLTKPEAAPEAQYGGPGIQTVFIPSTNIYQALPCG